MVVVDRFTTFRNASPYKPVSKGSPPPSPEVKPAQAGRADLTAAKIKTMTISQWLAAGGTPEKPKVDKISSTSGKSSPEQKPLLQVTQFSHTLHIL